MTAQVSGHRLQQIDLADDEPPPRIGRAGSGPLTCGLPHALLILADAALNNSEQEKNNA
jgi:hypothetical protein